MKPYALGMAISVAADGLKVLHSGRTASGRAANPLKRPQRFGISGYERGVRNRTIRISAT